MSGTTAKILSYVLYGLLGISLALGIVFYATENVAQTGIVNLFIVWAYILVGAAFAGAIVFPIIFIITNFKKAKSSLIGLGALGLVVLLAYLLASDEIPKFLGYEEFNITASLSRSVGTYLYTSYILGSLAIAAMLFAGVSKIFK